MFPCNFEDRPLKSPKLLLLRTPHPIILLNYRFGFNSVYKPSGTLSLPSPIIFIVRNNVNGKTLVDSPAFFPHD